MASTRSPLKSLSDHSDHHAAFNVTPFNHNWASPDAAGLLPKSLPRARIPRAWERKPYSPYSRKNGIKKVWRRVQMPALVTTSLQRGDSTDDTEEKIITRSCSRGGTIQSPKKVVKKLCLDSGFGQDSRITDWERERGSHLRKKVVPFVQLLPFSGLQSNGFETAKDDEPSKDEPGTVVQESEQHDSAEEWSDVPSDEELEELEVDIEHEGPNGMKAQTDTVHPWTPTPQEVLESRRHNLMEFLNEEVSQNREQEDQYPAENEQAATMENTCTGLSNGESDTYGADGKIELERRERNVSPSSSAKIIQIQRSPQKAELNMGDNGKSAGLLEDTTREGDDVQAASVASVHILPFNSPIKRSTSAPPEEVTPREARAKPRISDDTAILQAFLNRAAASKKTPSMAKQESLANRRDSDTVRQALASPAKVDVLGELDPNSPSPRKEPLPIEMAMKGKDDAPETTNTASTPLLDRPMRRSARSRTRPNTLLAQAMSSETPMPGPNRITIRSATDPVALKRSEVQEMALVTRSNTRKNKGQSIVPTLRLAKIAAEAMSNDMPLQAPAEKEATDGGKTVRWDQTLAYFSEHPVEHFSSDTDVSASTGEQVPAEPEAPPQSPTKARSRRGRLVRQDSVEPPPTFEPGEQETIIKDERPAAATPKPKPVPITRKRSRIATPAKGLLTTASLLPSDVLAEEESSSTTAESSQKTRKVPSRALPAPRKLNLTSSINSTIPTIPSQQEAKTETLKEVRTTRVTTPKKSMAAVINNPASATKAMSALPSLKAFAPRLAKGLDEETPGLASPAKKRRGAVSNFGSSIGTGGGRTRAREEQDPSVVPPGLSSPAKKRSRMI